MAVFRKSVALFTMVLLAGVVAVAQNVHMGEIRGTVTDPTGAVVPGVSVVVRNVATNHAIIVTTDSGGIYDAQSLLPGAYSITFSRPGFKTLVRSGIYVTIGALGVNASLELGRTTQQVEVSGAAPLVQTETAKTNLILSEKTVTDLPSTSYQWYSLTELIPGVAPSGGGQNAGGEGVSVSGGEGYMQNWLIDGGVGFYFWSENPDLLAVPIENIQEVDYETHNFGAEYGAGVNVFNVITKSGTNQFHGMLFEYDQNNAFSARNFFAAGVPPERYNRFGGNVGGPIKKNKAWFFFGYQRSPQISYSDFLEIVPTMAERAGDFSGANYGTIYNPSSLALVNGQYVRTPFPGNVIPANELSLPALNVQKYIGLPNTTSYGPYNFYDIVPTDRTQGWWNLHMDYDFSSTNRLDASYFATDPDLPEPSPWGPTSTGSIDYLPEETGQISDSWSITPNIVNELRFAALRVHLIVSGDDVGKGYNTSLGIPNVVGNEFPNISIGGPISISIGSYGSGMMIQNDFDESDSVDWVKGKHIIKFGGELAKYSYASAWPNIQNADFSFSGTFTRDPAIPSSAGLGYADFLTGLPVSWSTENQEEVGLNSGYKQFFIDDTYKLRPDLTVDLGLRFDHAEGFTEEFNRASDFSPTLTNPATGTPGALCFAGVGGCPTSWPNAANHFNPRIGVSWSPKPNWAFRGGYGIYDLFFGGGNYGPMWGPGWNVQDSESSPDDIHPIFTLSQGPPLAPIPTAATRTPALLNGQSITYIPSNTPLGYLQDYQVDVQHQLPGGFVVDVAYVGTRGTHLPFGREINAVPPADMHYEATDPAILPQYTPYPQYFSIAGELADGNSDYNALQLRAEKRMSRNLGFIVNYAWSRNMDLGTSEGWSAGANQVDVYQQPYNPSANYAAAQTNLTNEFSASAMYNLPVGAGHKLLNRGGIVNAILGGWETTSIVELHSGLPFTPTIGTTNLSGLFNTSQAGSWFPNRVGSGAVPNPTLDEWFNPSAFTTPQTGTFGDSGRNILLGPGWATWDASVAKNWKISRLGEGGQFQFRIDATDVLNRPNFCNPNASIGTPGVGTITCANTSRTIQFGARLYF